jgi:cytidylate kinase
MLVVDLEGRRDDSSLTPSAPARSVERVTCRVVCISHTTGAGGEDVGRLVAERLGFLYVDDEIVARAAAKGGIAPGEVADEERRKLLVARVLEAIAQGGSELRGSIPLRIGEELNSDDIRALIRETIERTAARGNTVIVAHAASHAVTQGWEALRVLVTASPHIRAARVGGVEGLDQARAERAVKDSDAGRRDYLRRFYDVGEELPTHYDLVVNTDVLSVEQAAELVSQAASS